MPYYAKYWTTDPKKCLPGAVLKGQSSRFERVEDAFSRLNDVIEHSPQAEGKVVKSNQYPELFSHCPGTPAQSINGKCFGCGKVLLVDDAKANLRHNNLFDAVIDGLHEYYPILAKISIVSEIHGKVTYHETGNDQADYESLRDEVESIIKKNCDCGNPEFGFDCVCQWVKDHPGNTEYSCEFCGCYTASEPRCNKCEND